MPTGKKNSAKPVADRPVTEEDILGGGRKTITRSDAAKLLGVHPQTVSNLASDGVLSRMSVLARSGRWYQLYYEDEILARRDDVVRIYRANVSAEECIRKAEEQKRIAEEKLEENRRMAVRAAGGIRHFLWFQQIAERGIGALLKKDERLSDREKGILRDILSFSTPEEMCARYGITRERVRQLCNKAIRRLGGIAAVLDKADEALRRNAVLEAENARLARIVKEIDSSSRYRISLAELAVKLKETRLGDVGFSVRSYNGLRSIGVENIYDLVRKKPEEVQCARNLGRKSFLEIEDIMGRNGWSFGIFDGFSQEDLAMMESVAEKQAEDLIRKLKEQPIPIRAISFRAALILNRLGVENMYDLVMLDPNSILHARNSGKKTLMELTYFLKRHNLEFGMFGDAKK